MDISRLIDEFGLDRADLVRGDLPVHSPIDGGEIARVRQDSPDTVTDKIARAHAAFLAWRQVPPPRRGELVRLYGEQLRYHKEILGRLVTIECGKILQEGLGEVQEMIDICDFAVGLSRQLYGLTIASERPGHRMMETWHPLGVVGVISAFNFPAALWSWNAALAFVCGDSVVWKPSEKTPLTALACRQLFRRALAQFGEATADLLQILVGGQAIGESLADSPQVALVSATGSVRMGQAVAPRVAGRLGRCLLELGGNNAMIVAPSADLDRARETGAEVFGGARILLGDHPGAFYVQPAIVEMPAQTDLVKTETFAPILYVLGYEAFADAIELHNGVPQGLSSSIFTTDLREAEQFMSAIGSDCGVVNVNIGPPGAEIGGAFGGEKQTGGGREAGSDSWKSYMRRATNTINYSGALPLAQGIRFDPRPS